MIAARDMHAAKPRLFRRKQAEPMKEKQSPIKSRPQAHRGGEAAWLPNPTSHVDCRPAPARIEARLVHRASQSTVWGLRVQVAPPLETSRRRLVRRIDPLGEGARGAGY